MTKESIVFFLGIVVFIVPHIGVPEVWKTYALATAGIVLIIVGYALRRKAYIRSIENVNGERDTDSFTENRGSRAKSEEKLNV